MIERLSINISKYNSQQIANIIKDLIDKSVFKIVYGSDKTHLKIQRKLEANEQSVTLDKLLYQIALSKTIEEYSGPFLDLLFIFDSLGLKPHYILCGNKKKVFEWAKTNNIFINTLCGMEIFKINELEDNCALFLSSKDSDKNEEIEFVMKVTL